MVETIVAQCVRVETRLQDNHGNVPISRGGKRRTEAREERRQTPFAVEDQTEAFECQCDKYVDIDALHPLLFKSLVQSLFQRTRVASRVR